MRKNIQSAVNLFFTVRDSDGFLVDRTKKFSTFLEAIKFVRENKNGSMKDHIGKPLIK